MLTRTAWVVLSWLLPTVLAMGLVRPLAAAEKPNDGEKLPAFLNAKEVKPAEGDDALHKLLKARYNAALQAARARYLEVLAGRSTQEQCYPAFRTLLRSELEMAEKPAAQLAVREKFVTLTKEVESIFEQRFKAGQSTLAEYATAQVNRLTAEIELLKAKEKAAGAGK
jgi:hypothetical protein